MSQGGWHVAASTGGDFSSRVESGGTGGTHQNYPLALQLDHAFTVAGDGSDGGRKQAAASATIEIRLEEARRYG